MKTDHRQLALKSFQKLRRIQSSENGICACISCGKKDLISHMQGGHYISRRCRATELEPDNVNPQCVSCNLYLNGNTVMYRVGLIESIGLERVERLENLFLASRGSDEALEKLDPEDRKVLKKKTTREYQELRKMYDREIKELI
jgi:hypothetical protein